jgi:Ser-tRNA(Ala) deacylase AlaX
MNKNIDSVPTRLRYWEDQDLRTLEAEILEVREGKSGKVALVLDETIFYPQGGGQPSDTGYIDINGDRFNVELVKFDQNLRVLHWMEEVPDFELCGVKVCLNVYDDKRRLHTQYHTGAHLLDLMFKLDCGLPFGEFKRGKQFPGDAYMSVEGVFDGDPSEMICKMNEILEELRQEELDMVVSFVEKDGETYRSTYFEGYEEFAVGCGGTHVMNTKDLDKVLIDKIKCKKGKNSTTVWYRMVN